MVSIQDVQQWLSQNIGHFGVVLAYIVASIHVLHPKLGLLRLALFVKTDSLHLLINHPRPLAFVMSGVAIIVGVSLAGMNYRRRLIYALGIVLMVILIFGYLAWHLSGHGGFLPGRKPLYHGMTPLEALVSHLREDNLALLSKLSELCLLAIIVVLYRREGTPSST